MDHVTTCPRCRAGIFIAGLAEWSVVASAQRLREQGWVGFTAQDGGRTAVHLSCLTWPEKEALLGAAREPAPRVHPARPARPGTRFVRRAPQPAEPAHAA
jgi:hypothetical protein